MWASALLTAFLVPSLPADFPTESKPKARTNSWTRDLALQVSSCPWQTPTFCGEISKFTFIVTPKFALCKVISPSGRRLFPSRPLQHLRAYILWLGNCHSRLCSPAFLFSKVFHEAPTSPLKPPPVYVRCHSPLVSGSLAWDCWNNLLTWPHRPTGKWEYLCRSAIGFLPWVILLPHPSYGWTLVCFVSLQKYFT